MKRSSAVLTLLLIAAALAMAQYHALLVEHGTPLNLVEFALSSMSILYGGLLGIFALGITTRQRGSPVSVIAGLSLGALIGLALFLHPVVLGYTRVAWPWWIPIAALASYALASTARTTAVFHPQKPD